ncbi:GerAB/ArcD/ProY family transporter [Caldisalinibacter kiritimatiensis]|uniref:Spore germination protein n=1 Tax=Caldisalinibacter kiritimatiensis TaxID=1304284 RepID=R1ARK8_9FIRM|nr:endospore germination permease [Caldisalinibacter kiritimatiensis]EOC99782.1 spore germination protein [Caldisalinibacter kiritimatiensis]
MRYDKNDVMSSGQLFAFIASSIVGTGMLSLASAVSEVAGRDGWISTIIGGLVVLIGTLIIIQLAKRFPNETFIEYIHKITGKFLGYIIVFLYILFSISSSAIVLRSLAYLLNTWFLRYTPKGVIIFFMIILCVYLSRNGIKVLARFSQITFFILLPLVILIFPPVISNPTFYNIRPVGNEGILNILKGVMPAIYSFLGFEVLLVYFPFVKPRKKVTKSAVGSIVFVVTIYTLIVLVQLIVFPQSSIMQMWMPTINYVLDVRLPFLERVDLAFIYFWIYAIFTTATIQFYTATVEIKQLFKLSDRKNICLYLAPIVFIGAISPDNLVEITKITDIISKVGVVVTLVIPTVLLVLSVIFSKRSENNV